MLKLVVLLCAISIGGLLIGVPGLITAIRYREPVTLTDGKRSAWDTPDYVRLQQLSLDGAEALQTSADRRGARIYIPVRYQGGKRGDKVNLVLESDDPALFDAITRLGGKPSMAKSLAALAAFAGKTEATGLVEVAVDHQLEQELRKITPTLASDFVIVREGEHPSFGLPLVALAVAIPALATLYWLWIRRHTGLIPRPSHRSCASGNVGLTSPAGVPTRRCPPGRRG